MNRRDATCALLGALGWPLASRPALATTDKLNTRWAAVEAASAGGRLGVALLDTGSGRLSGHRMDERFPLCSTFKMLAAARVLARVDRAQESLSRRIVYPASDLVAHSPVTGQHAGEPGLPLSVLCEATVTQSDNTAGNLILDSFGGPAGLTAWLREIGDPATRLDRRETALNEARAGDPRDTTTPAAMVRTMQKILLGSALSEASRRQLADWLVANRTGDERIRAGVPRDWLVGDKTGTGDNGTANDVAILWPPGRAPLLLAVYLTGSRARPEARNAAIAEVARAMTTHLG